MVCFLTGCVFPVRPLVTSDPHISSTLAPLPTKQAVPPTPSRQDLATPTPTDIIFPSETQDSQPQAPAPSPFNSSTTYSITVQLDYNSHQLSVLEKVSYTNPNTESLTNLVFLAEPNRYPGCFYLNAIHWGNNQTVEGYTLEGNRLSVPLIQPLAPTGSISLTINYNLELPAIPPPAETTRPVPFGYTDRQTNLVDWYLFLPPYKSPQGWLIHNPWYYGEHQAYDIADFKVRVQIDNPGSGLIVAASALPEKADNFYTFQHKQARSFALSISPDYHVISETVGTVTAFSYAFPFDLQASEMALKNTTEALSLYSQWFGTYPHPSLSIVEADFLDGMEYDGLYFLSRGFYNLYDGSPKGYLTMIAVHETAHQWWYGLVGNDQALEPWLDEALCTYSEKLFYENKYPDLVDWWWYFRVNFYTPEGWVNKPIYSFNGFRPYVNAVYLRGVLFLEELRKRIGDEAFFATLKDYVALNLYQQATANDFFGILKTHSTATIDDLLSQYFQPLE